jgi:hypothetical protein
MQNETQFFMIWAHRGAESLFGAASKPVIRNGSFLCFPSEASARAECDRLNAGSGGAHYSVEPTPVRFLKQIAETFSVLPRPTTASCNTFSRRPVQRAGLRRA